VAHPRGLIPNTQPIRGQGERSKSLKKFAAYENRITRITPGVALEHPDRIPVVLEYSSFAPLIMRKPAADFLGSTESNLETMISEAGSK
jgi:hypothetical protein